MPSTIEEHFSAIANNRQQYNVKYPVLDIFLITLVGVICGADGWEGIEEVGRNKLKIAEKIIHKEADYVLPVKGNQGYLSSAIRDFFDIAHEENRIRKGQSYCSIIASVS